ncbi:MAG: capsule assembly Wzi family protein [Mediterranea sp.]|jgi:hypothetical protein|nr:capsule assembly Wzi family protein [Mediterranea sp.]
MYKSHLVSFLVLGLFVILPLRAQDNPKHLPLSSFVEYGATVHHGDNTPLWQVGNQYGLSSLKNNTYLRAGTFYADSIGKWQLHGGLDMAVAAGFTSTFVLQQAYADIRYWKIALFGGTKEIGSPLLNRTLSSGDLTYSDNARPVPQIMLYMPDYMRLGRLFAFKVEFSYGWFTDGDFLKERVQANATYVRGVKYHHKSLLMRIGAPQSKWRLDLGIVTNVQFGGYEKFGDQSVDLGNTFKDYLRVLIPQAGGEDTKSFEQEFYQGNTVGSEYVMGTYRHKDFMLRAYLQNHFDDMSAMGKQNGFDGLWGLEYRSVKRQVLSGVVLEYFQTTNQSGPLHGIEDVGVGKTGGGDNYYNHWLYGTSSHWGMLLGNPLIPSPIYNKNHRNTLYYNRVQAVHVGVSGDISCDWSYTAKLSYNKTFGTHYAPLIKPIENFSTFVAVLYAPHRLEGWTFHVSAALDTGEIYGDNVGFQLKIKKTF